VDFWNLAGRAGRLTKDLSGNIICLRVINKKNRWDKPDKDLKVVKVKEISTVESILMTNKSKFYTNIGKSIEGKPFTRKSISDNEKKMLDSYANILAYHSLTKTDSILRSKFIDHNKEGTSILHKIDSNIEVPKEILAQSTNIKLVYQNNILTLAKMLPEVPEEVNYKSCLAMLNILYDYYNWKEEESGGRKPLVKDKSILTYYAVLMNSWINSKPLNVIIKDVINYYTLNKRIIFLRSDQAVIFDPKNRFHINKLVNTIVSDIENVLRFKIKNYVSNYTLLINEIEEDSSVIDWSEYLEYGTTDKITIELQNLGFPRHLATLLKNKYIHFFIIENNVITDFYAEELISAFDKERFYDEFIELSNILE